MIEKRSLKLICSPHPCPSPGGEGKLKPPHFVPLFSGNNLCLCFLLLFLAPCLYSFCLTYYFLNVNLKYKSTKLKKQIIELQIITGHKL
jgi:hypothetical protein